MIGKTTEEFDRLKTEWKGSDMKIRMQKEELDDKSKQVFHQYKEIQKYKDLVEEEKAKTAEMEAKLEKFKEIVEQSEQKLMEARGQRDNMRNANKDLHAEYLRAKDNEKGETSFQPIYPEHEQDMYKGVMNEIYRKHKDDWYDQTDRHAEQAVGTAHVAEPHRVSEF